MTSITKQHSKTCRPSTAHPVSRKICLPNTNLAVHEWKGTSDPVLLLHATGFHGRCWDYIARQLPELHIYAVDLRFHGASDKNGDVDWIHMAEDITQLIKELNLTNILGTGHSIGGHLLARAAATIPTHFKQLLLIDPVILSLAMYEHLNNSTKGINPEQSPVSRRLNRWKSSADMFQRFKDKPPFNSWQPQILQDYCRYGLQPCDSAETYRLACLPHHEAAVYLNQTENHTVHDLLDAITMPTTILRAPPAQDPLADLASSPTWPELVNALPNAQEIYLPDNNHFIPMEDPMLVVGQLKHLSRL